MVKIIEINDKDMIKFNHTLDINDTIESYTLH